MTKKVLLIVYILLLLPLFGCGADKTDAQHSPGLTGFNVYGDCKGSEDGQFVVLHLSFDKKIQVSDRLLDEMKITIAGNRIKKGDCSVCKADETSAEIKISVTAVTNGKLKMEPIKEGKSISGICDESGEYCVHPFKIDCLIPSGVTLETVKSGDNFTVKRVTGTYTIRSIAWVRLLVDGKVIKPEEENSLEILDGAVAVHGHDFLQVSEDDIAFDMADVLTEFFGDAFSFQANGPEITVTAKDENVRPDLAIYQYGNFENTEK